MMSAGETGQLSVPPGFRFHPTDEELLYYYLRKKVSYEAIDLDVIREIDLNKLEPWDLKDKCRIGSGLQHEWYFFSHKDKKYPTGTRTNRATTAGFWKATGRDKAIHLHSNSKRIGLRKTLVFYTGRAPHGQKTDWIMHEYRLDDEYTNVVTPTEVEVQEEGWVVCRVFKKKNHTRSPFQGDDHQDHTLYAEEDHHHHHHHLLDQDMNKHSHVMQTLHTYNCNMSSNTTLFDASMHLPQLLTSPHEHIPYFPTNHQSRHMTTTTTNNNSNNNNNNEIPGAMMSNDMHSSKNLLNLMSMSHGGRDPSQDKSFFATSNVTSDWSFLDKLLASNQHPPFGHHNQQGTCNDPSSSHHYHPPPEVSQPSNVFPIHNYHGYETDLLKFSK